MMKKILFTVAFACMFTIAFAQEDPSELPEKKQQNIEALKVAFISKELDLTPEEAQKFWPVYNQYSKEMISTFKAGNDDVLDRDEKVLNVRKRYKEQFSKVLGGDRVNKMFGAEGRFRQLLIKAMRNQKQQRPQNMNRPQQRRGPNQ
jgi:hypothetical protein